MAQDFEQLFKDILGEPLSRLTQFQSDQMARLMAKLREVAREAVSEEMTRMQAEINDLRARVATLEAERVQSAAEQV